MYRAPNVYFITVSQELSKCVTGTDILNVAIRCNALRTPQAPVFFFFLSSQFEQYDAHFIGMPWQRVNSNCCHTILIALGSHQN